MKIKLAIAAGLLLSLPLFASVKTPCVKGTLASYIALGAGGCSIGNVTFANFSYPTSTTNTIPANEIVVTPLAIVFDPGLTFTAPWAAASGQSESSMIGYTVSFNSLTPLATSGLLKLLLGTAKISNIIGSVEVDETATEGNVADMLSVYEKCTEVCTIKSSDQLAFSPVNTLHVTDKVTITGGNGGASLSGYTVYFVSCPACAA